MVNDTIILVSKAHINLSIAAKDSIIQDLTHNLTKRVDAIDNMDFKFWITILTPTILTVFNLWIVIRSYKKDKERSMLSNISTEFDTAENRFLDSHKNNVATNLLKKNKEDVLNSIEYLCYQFNRNDVNRNDFNFKFQTRIDAYYESFIESYDEYSMYNETKKYYKKFHKIKKKNKLCSWFKRMTKK